MERGGRRTGPPAKHPKIRVKVARSAATEAQARTSACFGASWSCSHVLLPDGRYTAVVGAYTFQEPDDGKPDYFCIDIETPSEAGSHVVGVLSFPLEFVSEERLLAPAEQVVAFDLETKVVTYDLGRSVFKFQLPQQ